MNRERNATSGRSKALLTCLIVAIVSFAAGMRSHDIFGAIAQGLGLPAGSGSIDLSSVQETYRSLSANYDGDIDIQQLIYGANEGLVAAIGDTHTKYLDPEGVKELEQSLSGNIGGGIGAEIGMRNGSATVIRPLKDSPAAEAGVQAGDVVVAINDQSTLDWTLDQTIKKIRGDIGTKVKLSVLRSGEKKDITVTRQEITSPTVEAEISGDTGVLIVHRFNGETGTLARTEAEKFIQAGVKKVILDLRGNPGGEVPAAQALAGLWLDKEVLLTHRRDGKVVKTDKSTGSPILSGIKTVVLIDGGSASASEIIAGALKEYGKATLVGEKTYGKGSVQAVLRLGGGAQLKVTESRWFTPKGKNIDKEGISPDVEVKLTADDFNNNRDPQLDKAKAL